MTELCCLQLQDYSRVPSGESEVKFHLSRVTLEPMLKSMAYISEQLSTPANKVAVINLKVCAHNLINCCLCLDLYSIICFSYNALNSYLCHPSTPFPFLFLSFL